MLPEIESLFVSWVELFPDNIALASGVGEVGPLVEFIADVAEAVFVRARVPIIGVGRGGGGGGGTRYPDDCWDFCFVFKIERNKGKNVFAIITLRFNFSIFCPYYA